MGGNQERSARVACFVAFTVHLGLFALVRRIELPAVRAHLSPIPVEIDVLPESASFSRPNAEPSALARLEHATSTSARSGGPPRGEAVNEASTDSSNSLESTWRLGGLFAEDSGTTPPTLLPAGVLQKVAAAQGALAHDHEAPASVPKPDSSAPSLSFARANALRARVSRAMSDPDAPMYGVATLEFTITPSGISLAGVHSTNGDGEWTAWADKLAKQFDASVIPIPSDRAGLRVRMYVEAIERSVDGPPPPKKGGYLRGTPFEAKEDPKDKNARIELKLPTASIGYEGKKCGAGVTVGAGGLSLNGGCELAPATRQVRARIVEESLF